MSTRNWKDSNVVSFGTNYKGLKNLATGEQLPLEFYHYTSLIPSRGNTPSLPLVATYNKKGDDNNYVRGIVCFGDDDNPLEISLDGETYDFIDGVDHGLARAYRIIGGQKKWGIIGLFLTNNGYKAKILISLEYDNIWNFYDKNRKTVPAYKDDFATDISLEYLKEVVTSTNHKTLVDQIEQQFLIFEQQFDILEEMCYHGAHHDGFQKFIHSGDSYTEIYAQVLASLDSIMRDLKYFYILRSEEIDMICSKLSEFQARILTLSENNSEYKESYAYLAQTITQLTEHLCEQIKTYLSQTSLHSLRDDSVNTPMNELELSNPEVDGQFEKNREQMLIKEIEVCHFKRFIKTTSLDISSRIIFCVGKNNAGKSTFLEAINLCTSNMTNHLIFTDDGTPYFCFEKNKSIVEQNDVFKKKLSHAVESQLSFILTIGEWKFEFFMDRDASVERIEISSILNSSRITFTKECVKIKPKDQELISYSFDGKWISHIQNVEDKFYKGQNQGAIHSINQLDGENELQGIIRQNSVRYKGLTGFDRLLVPLWDILFSDDNISLKQRHAANEIRKSIDSAITTGHGVERIHVFASIGKKKYQKFQLMIGNEEYRRDVDFVTESIINFYPIKEIYREFVCKWLDNMEMGKDFFINKDEKDDSYTMTVTQEDGVVADLCDMGSGTIHFVALCFKLLALVNEYKDNVYAPMILIEEPEQNLHPMLQSHMANFLVDVSDLYAELSNGKELKMIVETHSEYIIRRSQVTARRYAKRKLKIPYQTYYFSLDRGPYDMVYTDNGMFQEVFEPGFTDESSILSFQLL